MLKPEDFEINASSLQLEVWPEAKQELELINTFVTPLEKQLSILNCCKILIYVLSDGAESGILASACSLCADCAAGADALIPNLIWVVLMSDIANIMSNISYISRFADPERQTGEEFCFFTNFALAATYLNDASAENFPNVPQSLFKLALTSIHEAKRARQLRDSNVELPQMTNSSERVERAELAHPAAQHADARSELVTSALNVRHSVSFDDDLYQYVDCSFDQLTMADVSKLLVLYKRMAVRLKERS